MANSKPGARRPSKGRSTPSIPAAARVPTADPTPDVGGRLHACEVEIERAHAEVALLRAEVGELRLALTKLGGRVASATARKLPPPLPDHSASDVISVDPSEVTIESIRPRPPRIR
jgi:hypothetical protein